VKTLTVARAAIFVALLAFLLYAMPWSYLPLLFANIDTQAILTRSELRRVMAPLIVVASLGVAWTGLDAYLGIKVWKRERSRQSAGPAQK